MRNSVCTVYEIGRGNDPKGKRANNHSGQRKIEIVTWTIKRVQRERKFATVELRIKTTYGTARPKTDQN